MSNSRHRRHPNPAWATQQKRIEWLVKTRFAGNRSALAKAIGFSHTIIAKVIGGANPGPRLLDAVITKLGISAAWLRDGEGQPFSHGIEKESGIPVTDTLLPGPPLLYQPLITGWLSVPEIVPSGSVYWLLLRSSEPIVRNTSLGFRAGDQLLMETDPAKFPRETHLVRTLCAVRAGSPPVRLVIVEHHAASDGEEERLEADFCDASVAAPTVEHVYRHEHDGAIRHFQRRLLPESSWNRLDSPPIVRYADIISVWLGVLRRPIV